MGRLERLSASVMARVGRWESVFVSSPPLSFACSAHPRCVAPIFLGQDLESLFRVKLAGCHLIMMAASGLRLEVKASKQNGVEGRREGPRRYRGHCTAVGQEQPIMSSTAIQWDEIGTPPS